VAELRRADLAEDPLEQFRRWFEEARPVVRLPEAMAVATAAPDGGPSVRMLLLKPRTFLAFVVPARASRVGLRGAAAPHVPCTTAAARSSRTPFDRLARQENVGK
jgi:pyridoxine/pyridoxamine 5'-phosphate oxidase